MNPIKGKFWKKDEIIRELKSKVSFLVDKLVTIRPVRE